MGRTVVAEDSLQDKLNSLGKAGCFQIGLLIGQNTSDKDYFVHLAPTPTVDEGDVSSEDEDAVPKPEKSKTFVPDSIGNVIDSVVAEHARQVVRMIPGGLDIIGIFVVTPLTDFNNSASQSKLRSVLGAVHRASSKISLGTTEVKAEKIILHICTQSFKILCKSADVTSVAPGPMNSLDVRFQKGGIRWQQLSYSYNINLNFWLPKETSPQALYKMVLTCIKPWVESLQQSLILFDCELLNDSDLLSPEVEEKPKKKGGGRGVMDLTPPKVVKVDILDNCIPLLSPIAHGKEETTGCIRLVGDVSGLSFVHSKATAKDGRFAVLMDLVRSVLGRWEMHCDSLIEEPPSHLVGPIIHEPPRRVFFEGGALPVSLCDYLFPGDTKSDACQSAKELLGIRVRDEHIDDTLEVFKEVENIDDSVPDVGLEKEVTSSGGSSGPCSLTHILLAFAVSLIGVGFSYLAIQGEKVLK